MDFNCDFILWREIFSGVPLGHFYSIYIYTNDIFFFIDKAFLSNYGDGTAIFSLFLFNLFLRKILLVYKNGSVIIIWS